MGGEQALAEAVVVAEGDDATGGGVDGEGVAVELPLLDVASVLQAAGFESLAGVAVEGLQGFEQVAADLVAVGVGYGVGGGDDVVLIEAVDGAAVDPIGEVLTVLSDE